MNGILFGSKHSWTDWNLILTEKPDISFPETKTHYLDLTGSDGQIDLTESLTGEVKYQNRIGSLQFIKVGNRTGWTELKSTISDYLHGKRFKMIIDEDDHYFYMGRFFLNEWKSNKKTGELTIDYDLEPYKYELLTSLEDWIWDSFNFENDVIRGYESIEIEPNTTITLYGSRKTVVPEITVSTTDGQGFRVYGAYGVKGESDWFILPDGTYVDPYFILREGSWDYLFDPFDEATGIGTITVDFRGGRL